eukprot:CAMPEP_0113299790 /NCGR_PEP_ID=MMETSP0010_2-20120614/1680_1 /TAXON_ID=216773 ORGANISM="Corethron hystrix, Strain 308" /NCGR_SAMPLE_ID=MMETSP0010_2 /ASSEMBLY_ACC=CAM_ASM_000155 /LENGTH=327 /DNA_ID=CAMNT_0000153087 /DNA_START=118 /DNA_END=1101 /DNA_ORIENTATION=+ /assembly_acc=CAM_ASM_000155
MSNSFAVGPSPQDPSMTIVCDIAGYSWPTSKRPRTERIRAVSRLSQSGRGRCVASDEKGAFPLLNCVCHIVVVGRREDLDPVRIRVEDLEKRRRCGSVDGSSQDDDKGDAGDESIIYEYTDDLMKYLSKISQKYIPPSSLSQDSGVFEVPYLSPEADAPIISPPRITDNVIADEGYASLPPIVIVGMIVDRSVAVGRSLKRAQAMHCGSRGAGEAEILVVPRHLPLSRLCYECVPESCLTGSEDETGDIVRDDEPLNIDTVLEILQRWVWYHGDIGRRDARNSTDLNSGKAFLQAAAEALQCHLARHPKRVIHNTSKMMEMLRVREE